MGKALRTAAIVVGAAGAIIATAGILAPVATASALGGLGITATASSVATIAGAVSAGLSIASTIVVPKGSIGGAPSAIRRDAIIPQLEYVHHVDREHHMPRATGLSDFGQRLFLARRKHRLFSP